MHEEPPSSALADLLARQALLELVCLYSRLVDRREFEGLRALYHPAAIHDHGGLFCGGIDAFVPWLQQSPPGMLTHHFVGNALFSIEGDSATGEIYTINYHVFDATDEPGRDYVAGGRYLDRYCREQGRWMFSHRQRILDWSHERAAAPAATGAGITRGAHGAADPSHGLLGRLLRD